MSEPAPDSSPAREFAVEVVRELTRNGHVALFAGGCVRDALLGKTPKDYDVATDAEPSRVREIFGPKRTYAVGESFGVILVRPPRRFRSHPAADAQGNSLPNPEPIEVATFRKEGPYLDGRHPEHVEFCTPAEDARRRDFTINGLFYDPLTDTVHDYVGGRDDLSKRVVRCIGRPLDRMTEDKLRMLRAVRFTATFDFALDDETHAAVVSMAEQLSVVSAERIAQELRRMLAHPNRTRAVDLLCSTNLLGQVLPEIDADTVRNVEPLLAALPSQLSDHDRFSTPRLFEQSLALLLRTVPERVIPMTRRLKLSNEERDRIDELVRHRHAIDEAHRLPLAKLKRLLIEPFIGDLVGIGQARVSVGELDPEPIAFVQRTLETMPEGELNPPPLLDGRVLIELGIRPGPRFKTLLDTVRDAQLAGEIETPEAAKTLASRLANES